MYAAFSDLHAVSHNRLLLVAALICWLSAYGAFMLLARARNGSLVLRASWILIGATMSGFGLWATHFLVLLADRTIPPLGYSPFWMIASLAFAIASNLAWFAVAVHAPRKWRMPLCALLGGIGTSSVYFLCLRSIVLAGGYVWTPIGVFLSCAITAIAMVPACYVAQSPSTRKLPKLSASILLLMAIILQHATASRIVTFQQGDTPVGSEHALSASTMALVISALALSGLVSAMTATYIAWRAERESSATEKRLGLLIRSVREYAIYMIDIDGRISNWNAGAERIKGYSSGEIISQDFACFYTADEQAEGLPMRNLQQARATGSYEGEGWRIRKDGSRIWAHVVIDAVYDDMGRHVGFAKITQDRTAHRSSELELKKATHNLQLALTHMGNALCLFDETGKLVMYNPRINDILGIDPSLDLTGKNFDDILKFNTCKLDDRRKQHAAIRAQGGGETTTRIDSGKYIRCNHVPVETGAWVVTFEDITARVLSENRVNHLARHDYLTGLPNRGQYLESLEQAIEHSDGNARLAAINIDLNRFKEINDTHGHQAGDLVLQVIAKRMTELLGADELVARFGGDEFVAFKTFHTDDELSDFLSRLQTAITQAVKHGQTTMSCGASIGIAIYPDHANDIEKLLNNADMAMYRAKNALQDSICFYEATMDEAERARRALARDIEEGIEQGHFFLNYQPQCDAQTHELTGYEVLLRWQHPARGLISPDEFIPIAEEAGLISALGEWVLERACREAVEWQIPVKIAVNLSPLQLANIDLVDKVRAILLSTGLSPLRLELEVTESAIIGDKARALHILRQIRSMGVTVAIDDFGTGYSSMQTLRAFPFDKIKMDKSFVAGVENDRQAMAFVRAILALGKSLEVPVLIEGVETAHQASYLTAEGCDLFQGYHFGRPVRIEVIDASNRLNVQSAV